MTKPVIAWVKKEELESDLLLPKLYAKQRYCGDSAVDVVIITVVQYKRILELVQQAIGINEVNDDFRPRRLRTEVARGQLERT